MFFLFYLLIERKVLWAAMLLYVMLGTESWACILGSTHRGVYVCVGVWVCVCSLLMAFFKNECVDFYQLFVCLCCQAASCTGSCVISPKWFLSINFPKFIVWESFSESFSFSVLNLHFAWQSPVMCFVLCIMN